jgi:hypothetical protein
VLSLLFVLPIVQFVSIIPHPNTLMKFAYHSAISEFSRLLHVSQWNNRTCTENDGSPFLLCGAGSIVGIATGYGLDDLGI